MIKWLLILIFLSAASAQEPTLKSQNSNPCDQANYHDFDFWVGNWAVYGDLDKSGPLLGTNRITKSQGGCLITEHWTSANGNTGTSMNFYDGSQNKWVQHWVSQDGISISYSGGLDNDSMVLTGKIYYANRDDHPIRDFKGKWTPLDDGVVKQHFEESIDGGESWQPWFTGYYFQQTETK
ncbi:MAG: hypothetical protein DWP95_01090 [Proteobacteria bacterium]|nr:MAG: hypothetical protein DWP95_01090 [Pseudomonadota bacterium]